MPGLMYAGGSSEVKQATASQSVANGTGTATVTFDRDAKVVIVNASGNGYGPGTTIYQSSSSAGFSQLVSTGNFTEHSFGTWGPCIMLDMALMLKRGLT